jgi:hypothetical protein
MNSMVSTGESIIDFYICVLVKRYSLLAFVYVILGVLCRASDFIWLTMRRVTSNQHGASR